ncbi:hypothetical protein B0T16DRAFT_414736 [Cercophora newfieldiana]|uniref:Uncharacterized protein n=1 Tax=Cercophora newfieldiana TaxID=92897 RepID=A0AA40CQP1_9PEZI|nr:hypothetical protein B0T16DRAFT_414736 [Cercophora newfieldiana]
MTAPFPFPSLPGSACTELPRPRLAAQTNLGDPTPTFPVSLVPFGLTNIFHQRRDERHRPTSISASTQIDTFFNCHTTCKRAAGRLRTASSQCLPPCIPATTGPVPAVGSEHPNPANIHRGKRPGGAAQTLMTAAIGGPSTANCAPHRPSGHHFCTPPLPSAPSHWSSVPNFPNGEALPSAQPARTHIH